MINRRGLITGLISLAAAPAIVQASSLMPVKVMRTLTNQEVFLAIWSARLNVMIDLVMEDLVCGNYDENNGNGIILTSVRDYLKLDQSISSKNVDPFKIIDAKDHEV